MNPADFWVYGPLREIAHLVTSPKFYALTGAVLFFEWRFPARPRQKTLGAGFAQDCVWTLLQTAFRVTIIAGYLAFLRTLYKQHLDFLTIDAVRRMPGPAKILLGVLVADFLDWFHHWVRHKVPWFWHFHTVHHSQKELNLFTDLRYHALEYIVANTIIVVPLLMFDVGLSGLFLFTRFHDWYTRLYHANIRSDFGFLRYLFVTPQSHRIHHSIEPAHQDKNFGVLFSVWDRIFGTHYAGPGEYPQTGVRDELFPSDRPGFGWHLLWMPVRQHLYPFQAIARGFKR